MSAEPKTDGTEASTKVRPSPERREPAAVPDAKPSTGGGSAAKSLLKVAALIGVLAAAAYFGYPAVERALSTVSTDDAYVNAHVTYVAPRLSETVVAVKVDDNDFVKKGDLLIVLDKDAWTIRVAQAAARLDVARKTLNQQRAQARALAAQAGTNRYQLASAISNVKNKLASLRSAIAGLNESEAAEKLARLEAGAIARWPGTRRFRRSRPMSARPSSSRPRPRCARRSRRSTASGRDSSCRKNPRRANRSTTPRPTSINSTRACSPRSAPSR
jgi:membrane fusion protein (multidrug efflux system)